MLKISAHISKKVPLPGVDYSSQQFGASLELEVADSGNSEEIQNRLRQLYAAISRSVDEQIARAASGSASGAATRHDPATPKPNASAPAANGNGAANGRGMVPATQAQQRAIHALAKSVGQNLTDVLSEYSVSDPSGLSVRKASELIDKLKSRQGASR